MAAMKTSTGRLYMLFNACLPNNEKVKKRLIICKITESSEYNKLKNYPPFAGRFEQLFSQDKLAEYNSEKLDEIVKVLPKIIPLVERINNAITYGNALELTEKDIPDFTSVKSVDNLMEKLKIDSSTPNVTNITTNNFMAIFSDKTIKDPTEALKSISAGDIENPTEVVKKTLNNAIYCIKEKDIKAIQDTYAQRISEIKTKLDSIKNEKWKLRRKKWLYIGIAVIILTVINTLDLLSTNNSAILNLVSGILLILYFFIG